jgi:hypothetical protein
VTRVERNLLSVGESRRSLDIVPVLLGERVGFLLQALLAFRKTLVLADSHDCDVMRAWWRRKLVVVETLSIGLRSTISVRRPVECVEAADSAGLLWSNRNTRPQ